MANPAAWLFCGTGPFTRGGHCRMAGLATLAPWMRNIQPWRFRVSLADQLIELNADLSRMLKDSKPHGRSIHIACGAASINLRLAVAVGGHESVVRLLPAPGNRYCSRGSGWPDHAVRQG